MGALTARPLLHIYFPHAKSTYCGVNNMSYEIVEARGIVKEDLGGTLGFYRGSMGRSFTPIMIADTLWVTSLDWSCRLCKHCYSLHKLRTLESE